MQITEYGLSGIPIFNLSHRLEQGARLRIDFLPEFEQEASFMEYCKFSYIELIKTRGKSEISRVLSGIFPEKLVLVFLKKLQIKPDTKMEIISEKKFLEILLLSREYPFVVEKRRDFKYAQVTQGGIPLAEINIKTMESNCCKNLFFCGEILDVDGVCGGFNLQWAWSSGWIAGVHSSQ